MDLCFDDNMDPATACAALSRVKTADDILIMQAFSITPFTQGSPPGPRLSTKKLRGEDIKSHVEEFLAQEAELGRSMIYFKTSSSYFLVFPSSLRIKADSATLYVRKRRGWTLSLSLIRPRSTRITTRN